MNNVLKTLYISAFMSVLTGCEHPEHASPKNAETQSHHQTQIKVATWNMEHLAYPSNTGCKPRTPKDILKLKNYANQLDANIIALQEVASRSALKAIFPEKEWQIILSERADSPKYECRGNGLTSTQQKVAFVVHKSIPIITVNHNDQFNLEIPGLRNGLAITVNTTLGETEILNLHLKSGCFVNDYLNNNKHACQILAEQVPILDSWIEQRESTDSPYIILGDFNHRLSTPKNHMFQVLNNNSNKKESSLHLTTEKLTGCHPRYPVPIDHIIMGGNQTKIIQKSASVHNYKDMNEDAMLSDHCAISITL